MGWSERWKGGIRFWLKPGPGWGNLWPIFFQAALWAVRENKRVWVSTHTKALQEQLLHQDLPTVQSLLKSEGLDLRFAVMGAGNYLCLDRLQRAGTLFDGEEAQTLKSLSTWAQTAETALRGKLPCAVPEPLWETIRRDPDLCLAKNTPLADRCLYQKDLALARKAHVVVINHALFFAGLPLKPADALILDEAHTLEEAASRFLGYEISNLSLKRLWDDLLPMVEGWRGVLAERRSRRALERAVQVARDQSDLFFHFVEPSLGLGRGKINVGYGLRYLAQAPWTKRCSPWQ